MASNAFTQGEKRASVVRVSSIVKYMALLHGQSGRFLGDALAAVMIDVGVQRANST